MPSSSPSSAPLHQAGFVAVVAPVSVAAGRDAKRSVIGANFRKSGGAACPRCGWWVCICEAVATTTGSAS
jgi:hypothetical protein